MIPCYIFDLDGTLFDCSHRLHYITGPKKDWRAFFANVLEDAPIQHMVDLCIALSTNQTILYVSGRSSECVVDTFMTIRAAKLPEARLYMRKEGDYRADDIVKGELLDQIIADGYAPIMAFDDRARVVKMWRDRGIPCLQVAEGDF